MLLEHNGATPKIDPTARIAPNAVLCGEVTIGANSSIGFGAVLTAESGSITVGQQLCHHGYGDYPRVETQSYADWGQRTRRATSLSHWLRGRGQRFSRHRSDSV
jgi:hypothetical protein